VPLGYDVRERKLVVNEPEASTVRLIFRRYAELGSVALLKAELDRLSIVSKRREGAGGSLLLHRKGVAPSTPCRSPGASHMFSGVPRIAAGSESCRTLGARNRLMHLTFATCNRRYFDDANLHPRAQRAIEGHGGRLTSADRRVTSRRSVE